MEEQSNITLSFRPLTLFVLERACAALEIDINDVLQGDHEERVTMTPGHLRSFCEVVLVEPGAWDGMPTKEAEALTALVLTTFFGTYYGQEMAIAHACLQALYKRTTAPGSGGDSTSIQRVLAEFSPVDYHMIAHQMPLSVAIIYLSTCAVNAMFRKSGL